MLSASSRLLAQRKIASFARHVVRSDKIEFDYRLRQAWFHLRICEALDDLVRAGKVRYVGFSDTPAWKVAEAQTIARFRGWGHSTWQEAVRLAEAARVKTLVLFHHDPSHDDAFMDRVAEEAAKMRPGTLVAKEGLTLVP